MLNLILVVVLVAAGITIAVLINQNAAKDRAERRRRYNIPDTTERIALAPPPAERTPDLGPEEMIAFGAESQRSTESGTPIFEDSLATQALRGEQLGTEEPPSLDVAPIVEGRMVNTPDGEMIVTTPPFELRQTLLGRRETAYARAIGRKLPQGVVLCPKVRLESLLTPTAPDGRDVEDWRTWRKRVRLRAVDFVVCDTRHGEWRPVIAINVDRPEMAVRKVGGGVDRMIDEVLGAAGLPFVRCSGDPESDWGMIAPYVRESAVA
jgi:hypothetical protein